MMKDGTLVGDTMVTTVMSNLALDRAVESFGGRVIRAGRRPLCGASHARGRFSLRR